MALNYLCLSNVRYGGGDFNVITAAQLFNFKICYSQVSRTVTVLEINYLAYVCLRIRNACDFQTFK